MTTVIRAARLAPEVKTVPVPSLQAEVRKIPVQVQPPVAPAIVPTYEEYKQRLAAELAALRQEATEAGRAEGLQQGQQQGQQTAETQYRNQLETLRLLLESVHAARQRYIEDIADDAIEIAFTAVTKILGSTFATREAAVGAVQEAVRCCKQRGRMLVKVAPHDFELLNARLSELLEGGAAREVELVADEQVKWGGCVLEGASGNLDARLETQMQRLCDTLLAARAKWP